MIRFTNWFVKLTGWLPYKLVFRTKIYYSDKSVQGRRIKGAAIIVGNHTSVYDFAQNLFLFFGRTLRCQMAELLFDKKLQGAFLKLMGGIKIDRNAHDYSCIGKSERIIKNGGVVEIFPEGRLPLKTETPPIDFKPGAAYLALMTNCPIIPVYTNGKYFTRERARVIIGTPVFAAELTDKTLSDSENVMLVTNKLREKIISLKEELKEYEKSENS